MGILGADFMKIGATLHGSDVHTRDAFANMDIAGYNYGEKRYQKDLKKYPQRLILGSETFCFDAYKFWNLAIREPRLIGDFVWSGMDYLGEVGIGAWEYADYAPRFDNGLGWISAGSGRIDLTGKPLGEALYTRVAFNLDKGPYIAVRPLNHQGKHSPSAWKMTNAMPSWSWRGYEKKKAYVEVYARAAKVELLVNGKSRGVKKSRNNCVFTFKTPYENGTVEAVAYNGQDQEIGRRSLTTAGEETCLRAVPEAQFVKPGRLLYIRLQYTDGRGIVKPTERHEIQVSVTGGRLLGLGSGCPFYPRSYLESTSDTYYGEAMAIVEADAEAGELTLHAADGTLTADVSVPIAEEAPEIEPEEEAAEEMPEAALEEEAPIEEESAEGLPRTAPEKEALIEEEAAEDLPESVPEDELIEEPAEDKKAPVPEEEEAIPVPKEKETEE